VGGQLAPRVGTKAVVTAGLASLGTALVWVSTIGVEVSYATTIVPQMVLMGLGLGLITTPATESILQVLPPARAGVGSAVNDATRLLGGTLGVAVIGSVYASLFASRLASALPMGLPASAARTAHESVGAALGAADQLAHAGHPALAASVHEAASTAFFHGLHAADWVAAGAAAAGALMALLLLPAHPTIGAEDSSPEAEPLDSPATAVAPI
jgi:hypothetical protein